MGKYAGEGRFFCAVTDNTGDAVTLTKSLSKHASGINPVCAIEMSKKSSIAHRP